MRGTLFVCFMLGVIACGPKPRDPGATGGDGGPDGPEGCSHRCSGDLHSVVDCNNNIVSTCAGADACDADTLTCVNACVAAESNKRSIGCDYYATSMDVFTHGNCFAAFVANTWNTPAHIAVKHANIDLPVADFIRIPQGSGPSLTYAPYDPVAGLPPGEVAVLFLGGSSGSPPLCPIPSAVTVSSFVGTGIDNSFQITTDVPVVAYQINPYGGGSAAVTAASLLLPTSVWDVDYVAVNVTDQGIAGSPSLNIVAKEDGTTVTIQPNAAIQGGTGIPAGGPGQPVSFTLNKGQHAQISQPTEITGSTVSSTKPIGFMAGQQCMNMPTSTAFCDHGEQMVPPVRALGHRYVAASYRPRNAAETSVFYRLVGAVDGTNLMYSMPVGGPATINKGQHVVFQASAPVVIESQDKEHPFMLFAYMTGSEHIGGNSGSGDPDFVYVVPPEQYLTSYVFFTDPTYPETNLVIVRSRGQDAQFHDVTLDCLGGAITGWQPISNDFELARVDLMTGNFVNVGNCSTGRREMRSDAPFGLWVWGWGTNNTTTFTANVSYGYPGGMNVQPINSVIF